MIFTRKPCHIDDQILAMRGYVRSLGATIDRQYKAYFAKVGRRRYTPVEATLRNMGIEHARELKLLAVAALGELRRLKAISDALYKPGEQILVTCILPDYNSHPERYLVYDVEPRSRGKYIYRAKRITKRGAFNLRQVNDCICPSRNIRIELCDLPLAPNVTNWRVQWLEAVATRRAHALREGRVELITALR